MMVTVENLIKTYTDDAGPFNVLNGLSLSVEKGEMVALVGASGAGKTTLLQIIGGLDRATSGTVLVDNVDLVSLRPSELARFRCRKIGFVFQFHHLMPDFTALENVFMPGLIDGKSKKQIVSRARDLLDSVGLSNRSSHLPSELSGGERQRVALARALFNEPALLLADEPTGNLDSENSMHMLELIIKTNKDLGQTYIVATHNSQIADGMDKTVFIKDGLVELPAAGE